MRVPKHCQVGPCSEHLLDQREWSLDPCSQHHILRERAAPAACFRFLGAAHTQEGLALLVMEYMPGGDLYRAIQRNPKAFSWHNRCEAWLPPLRQTSGVQG